MSDKIKNLTAADFHQTIASAKVPVLVDFWATWCGPCKAIAPVLAELAEEMDGKVQVCKVDVDQEGTVAEQFNIRAIPTLLLFKGGTQVSQMVGMVNKVALKAKLAPYLS